MSTTIREAANASTEVFAKADPAAKLPMQRLFNESGIQMGPFVTMAEERRMLGSRNWKHFRAKQLGVTVGAELSGIDLTAELPDAAIAEIREALHAYKVIFFRDQPLTPESHVAFGSRFGELEVHPFLPGSQARPELVRFEKGADAGGYENSWHHDVTWRAIPSMGAILHAVQVPELGGDTLFADMCAAYDGLSDEVKEQIDSLSAVHDFMKSFGRTVPADRMEETRAKYPLVEHPVVCTHTGTGRKYLYVNRIFVDHIVGLEPEESRQLLEHLCYQATYPEYQCRFHWTNDAVAFWDNRAVQHYAASDYYPEIRIMERASVVGDRPVR